ncbi:MAG: hypothetical protein BA872_08860 [Desulfobacterales bacterium C00003060]|nr:MAG: hypothetical protein BA872_08860 [Desulfobacterales bacterium C00003060]
MKNVKENPENFNASTTYSFSEKNLQICGMNDLDNHVKLRYNDMQVNSAIRNSNRSGVQRFRDSRFHFRPGTSFGMRIYEKSVNFVKPNPKFGAKLTIIEAVRLRNHSKPITKTRKYEDTKQDIEIKLLGVVA